MQTPVKALVIATAASLVALAVVTAVAGSQPTIWILWTAWALIAVTTAAAVVADHRQQT
ncbi:hypothetical protein [Streptomyces sp. NPDC048508]|uniref:hypothetical protein n=1 Tax=Streptomyces sp. NPDC048508 TaxID=3365561 RepID=UPI00371E82CB